MVDLSYYLASQHHISYFLKCRLPGAAEIPTLANIVPLFPDWHHAAVPGKEESHETLCIQRFRST